MRKMSKYFLVLIFGAGMLFAAEDGGTSSSSSASSGTQTATASAEKKGVAKAKIILPPKKTNWSKIKDLFM